MDFIFFGFIGVVITVLIVSGYRRAGRSPTLHQSDTGASSWLFWSASDTTHHSHHHIHGAHQHTHDSGHTHHSGCDHGGHDSGSSCDSGGGGGDSGGGGGGGSD